MFGLQVFLLDDLMEGWSMSVVLWYGKQHFMNVQPVSNVFT